MPKSSLDRWDSMFDVLLGRLHISLVSLLRILSSFFMSGFDNGTTYAILGFIIVFKMCIFCLIMIGDVINNLLCFLVFFLWLCFFGCSILKRELGLCPNMCKVRFV